VPLDDVDYDKAPPAYATTAPAELARRAESLHHAFALPDGEPSSMRNQWTDDDQPPVSTNRFDRRPISKRAPFRFVSFFFFFFFFFFGLIALTGLNRELDDETRASRHSVLRRRLDRRPIVSDAVER
jgi:hypothetical protein